MALTDLFSKGVTIGRITAEELTRARMDLQMARNQSRHNLETVEKQKQEAFSKALREKSKDLRTSYLNEITTHGFKIKAERQLLQSVEGQIRLVSVVEAIKDFQRRQVNSPLLPRLIKLRLGDLDKELQDIVKQGTYGDQMGEEVMRRWSAGLATEGSEEVRQLDALIEREQAALDPTTDVELVARKLNEEHNKKLEESPLSG